MLKIEYKFVDMPQDFTVKEKQDLLHNEAYLLLDCMLKDIGLKEYKIARDILGKPYIESSNLHFNISHTDGLVCCVVADRSCGIDCEKIAKKENSVEFAKRYFVGGEIEIMEKCGYDDRELLRIWTCKEALGKKMGCGVAKVLKVDSTKENCKSIIENMYIITVCL